MGQRENRQTSYRSRPLELSHIAHLVHTFARLKFANSDSDATSQAPVIDIDANNVAYKFSNKATNPVGGIMQFARALRGQSIHVCVVADGKMRYDTKRASATRRVTMEVDEVKARQLEQRLTTAIQNNQAADEILHLSKSLEKLRRRISRALPKSFAGHLEDAIQNHPEPDEGAFIFKCTESQADPLLGKRSIDGVSDIIVSNDSDFLVYNPKCLEIFDFIQNKKGDPKKIILATAHKDTVDLVTSVLKPRFDEFNNEEDIFGPCKFPLYEVEDDLICRATVACAIGNDYWEKGQHNFSVSYAHKLIMEATSISDVATRRTHICNQISKFATGTKGVSCTGAISTFANAFVYEPANEYGEEEAVYISDHPSSLEYYLRNYAPSNRECQIIPGTEDHILLCKHLGGGRTHEFLRVEGHQCCSQCNAILCNQCCVVEQEQKRCIECYRNSLSLGGNEIKTKENMMKELIDNGRQVPFDATFIQVLNMYEAYENFSLGEDAIIQNRYPLESTDELHREEGMFTRYKHECTVRDIGLACRSNAMTIMDEHFLVELDVRVKEDGDSFPQNDTLKHDIALLASAAGIKVEPSQSIGQMLEAFSVGTDNSKKYPGDAKPESIRPFREIKWETPTHKSKKITSREWRQNETDSTSVDGTYLSGPFDLNLLPFPEIDGLCSFDNEMIRVQLGYEAVRNVISDSYPHLLETNLKKIRQKIGQRVVKFRSDKAIDKVLEHNPGALSFSRMQLTLQVESNLRDAFEYDTCERGHPRRKPRKMNDSLTADYIRPPTKKRKRDDKVFDVEKKTHMKCAMKGCPFEHNHRTKFRRVPDPPETFKPNKRMKMSKERQITNWKKHKVRREWMRRMGRPGGDRTKHLRICRNHAVDLWKIPSTNIQIYNADGDSEKVKWKQDKYSTYILPKAIGKSSVFSPSKTQRQNKGNGSSRKRVREIEKEYKGKNIDPARLVCVQMAEVWAAERNGESLTDIHSFVQKSAGLDAHTSDPKPIDVQQSSVSTKKTEKAQNRIIKYGMDDLKPSVIKHMTGHLDILGLLETVITICGGSIGLMTRTQSKLTWLEEWLFFFQFGYGRTHLRWKDYGDTWDLRVKTAREIVRTKLNMIKDTRERWPPFVSLEEDEALRDEKWNYLLGIQQHRIIMHDNTNAGILPTPSDPETNTATYSKYYNGNVAKGGVATQPCGWERTLELFTGAVGDSQYIKAVKVLEMQDAFQNSDVAKNGSMIPFTNVFDKGYRLILDCLEHGKQLCWQPQFARSDCRYGSHGVLLTALVASTRSGNERSVKKVKNSRFISRGGFDGASTFDPKLLADMWLSWGFIMNFMYAPVH